MPTHRKLMRRWENPGQVRYLTFSCYRRLPLLLNDRIKQNFVDQLTCEDGRAMLQLLAYVVMPEHIHLLLVPRPGHRVDQVAHRLKRPMAEQVIRRWRELDAPILRKLADTRGGVHFWQRGGGYDRNIISPHELHEKIAYIHDNPVRRGLVAAPTEWPWSSARWYDGDRSGSVQIEPL